MAETEQFSTLVGSIYDTALHPARWDDALEQITKFMNGMASMFGLHNAAARTGDAYYSWGDDPKFTELYFKQYVKLNPVVVPSSIRVKAGDVFSVSTLMPYDEFRRSRFYLEWVEPQGYGDTTHVLIEKSATSFAHLGTVHSPKDSPADDSARKRMRLLAPHVCRAVAIGKILDLHKADLTSLSSMIDRVAAGIFLVRAGGEITYANQRARALLDRRHLVCEVDGVLNAVDRSAKRAFDEALTAAATGDAVRHRRHLAVPLTTNDGKNFVAYFLSLAVGRRRQVGQEFDAAAAVFVHEAALQLPTLIETVGARFRLTPSELRVLFAIIEVGGTPEAAAVLGISEETVRTYLKRVFIKTGAHRQVDLVKLVAGYANPLLGRH